MGNMVATCCPGLEGILGNEVRDKLRVTCIAKRGRVYFEADLNKSVRYIKCADNVYMYAGEFKCGNTKAHLSLISESLRSLGIENILSRLAKYGMILQKPWRVHISCSRSGKHTYSRFEAAEYASRGITSKNIITADEKKHDVALRLTIESERAEVWVKLTGAQFRFRGSERDFSAAALRPTIAHALIYASKPNKWDVFADPFCGSGTIASERRFYDYAKIICGDINPEAAKSAAANLGGFDDVNTWDATNLPVKNESVDVIVTNPPWNKQIIVDDLGILYAAFLNEAYRVLKKNGRMIIITDNSSLLLNYSKNLFSVDEIAAISIHGTLAGIYLLKK